MGIRILKTPRVKEKERKNLLCRLMSFGQVLCYRQHKKDPVSAHEELLTAHSGIFLICCHMNFSSLFALFA